MRSSILKLLTIITLLNISLLANPAEVGKKILKIEKRKIQNILNRRKGVKLNSMDLVLTKNLKQDGWYGYAFNLTLDINGKKVNQKHFIFSNGKLIAPDLIDLKTKRSFKL